MAITVLNEWNLTENSITSDLVTPYSILNVYYKATKTNVAYSTIVPDGGSTSYKAIEIDEDATFKYYLFNGAEYFKYRLLQDVSDLPIWKTAQGFNYGNSVNEYAKTFTFELRTFNSSDTQLEYYEQDNVLVSLWSQDIPNKYGFNLFEHYINNHYLPLKWSNNTFNTIYTYLDSATPDSEINNITTSKQLYNTTNPGSLVQELYFAKKTQNVYPITEPTSFHKIGDTLTADNIEIDGGTYLLKEIEKANLKLDKTLFDDDGGNDKSVVLSLQYGEKRDGDGNVGDIALTADTDFSLNNCVDSTGLNDRINISSDINIGTKHIIEFEWKRLSASAVSDVKIFPVTGSGGSVLGVWIENLDGSNTNIYYANQLLFSFTSGELGDLDVHTLKINRNDLNLYAIIDEGLAGESTVNIILSSNDDLIPNRIAFPDFQRVSNIKVTIGGLIAHWWKCNTISSGDIPDEGLGDLDAVNTTQQQDNNVNTIELELTPGTNHTTLGGDLIAYLDYNDTHGADGHLFINNISLTATLTQDSDASILDKGKNIIELLLNDSGGGDDFSRIIEIDYDPYGCYVDLLFDHPQLGYASYPFEGMLIEGLTSKKGIELSPLQTTMVNVNQLKEIQGYEANVKFKLSSQVEAKYFDLVKEIYNSRHVYMYVGNNGDLDSEVNWVSVEVTGTPNINYNKNKTSALFTVDLKMPTKLNNRL